MLRIKTPKPQYWKLENLEDFDGQRWVMRGVPDPYGPGPEADLEQNWSASPQWTRHGAPSRCAALKGDAYAGAGTTLSVDGGDREAIETFSPGTWQADKELKAGDSYRIRFHAPRPNALELVGGHQRLARPAGRRPADHAAAAATRAARPGRHALAAGHARSSSSCGRSTSSARRSPCNERRGTDRARHRGAAQLALLAHLAARPGLKRGTRTPYEFVRRVDAYLSRGFRYDERPAPAEPGQVPLEHFLFDTKAGYCQHFSGAMALLLRFGGIPARVATGFSPGGFRSAPGRVGRARPRRALVGRGVVRRHRLGHVRPDADRHARRAR